MVANNYTGFIADALDNCVIFSASSKNKTSFIPQSDSDRWIIKRT